MCTNKLITKQKKNAKIYQTETILYTYNQNTYTLLNKLQRRYESKEQSVNITCLTYLERLSAQSRQSFFLFFSGEGGGAPGAPRLDPRLNVYKRGALCSRALGQLPNVPMR